MIYFDNAATTPTLPYLNCDIFGNPSSPHGLGIKAERALYDARKVFFNISDNELTFTSGGTESNNLAILGFVLANKRENIILFAEPWEHPSILEPIKHAELHLGVKSIIAPRQEWNTATGGKSLACLSHVNHETGDINDAQSIALELKKQNPSTTILVDGAQGFLKESLTLNNIDMYAFSGHKFHAPCGTGGLFVKKGIRLSPLFYGGGQEKNLRPGTENLEGIIKMSQAATFHLNNSPHHVKEIYSIISGIKNELDGVEINSIANKTSPYILNMSFLGIKGETLVHMLSEKGVLASMGAACRSRKKIKTTLEEMGFGHSQSAVRFSFSCLNTLEEAVQGREIIINCVNQLRRVLRV